MKEAAIHLGLTPSHLKEDKAFQEHFLPCKIKIQNMILWWQRAEAIRLGDDYESIGRSVKMSENMIKLLDDCESVNLGNGKKPPKERPRLHNKVYK